MNVIRHTDPDFAEQLRRMAGASDLFDKTIEERTRTILDSVYARGDAAVLELTERFDGAALRAEQLGVTQAELLSASLKADSTLRGAVDMACRNIETFSRRSLRRNWHMTNRQGGRVGEKFELLSENPMGERMVASPALAAGRLILRGDKHVFCVEAK